MNFEQLLYVEVLSHSNSLSQAAATLHISKSGLSVAVSQLENELGIKLFERTYNGTQLSKAGSQLLGPALKILRSKNELENLAQGIKNPAYAQTIKVQYVNSMLVPLIERFTLNFSSHHSHTQINISCHHANTIINNVRNRKIAAGLIAINHRDRQALEDLTFTPVLQSTFRLIVGPSNGLYSKARISPSDLREGRFCLFDDPFNHEMFDRMQFVCGPLKLAVVTDDLNIITQSINEFGLLGIGRYTSLGQGLYPEIGSLKLKKLDKIIPDNFDFGVLTNPNVSLSAISREFIEGLLSLAKQQ